jgi:hypothetical protein
MRGGSITGNHALGTGNGALGGGVWCAGTFNFYDVEISGNDANNAADSQLGIGQSNNGMLLWPAGTTGYFDANGDGTIDPSAGDYNGSSNTNIFGNHYNTVTGLPVCVAGTDGSLGSPASKQTAASVFKASTP